MDEARRVVVNKLAEMERQMRLAELDGLLAQLGCVDGLEDCWVVGQ